MKFNDIKTEDKKILKTNKSKNTFTQNSSIIEHWYRFGTVGVYIMKNGKKGLFREIASYANDGKKPTSWAMKIYHTDKWHLQFGIHPNADITKNDIFLTEIFSVFEEKYEYLEITGNRKVVLFTEFESKKEVEDVANYIIEMFKNIELDFINEIINPNFITQENQGKLKIIGYFSDGKSDKASQQKFIDMVNRLNNISMSGKDESNFNIIKKRILQKVILSSKDKQVLNDLLKEYLSDHDRISIAMKYLKKDGK